MLLDKQNMFSWKQAITVSANSENVIYLGGKNPLGTPATTRRSPFLNIDETFTAAGAATLTVALQSSALENFASGVVTHWSKTFARADLPAAGKVPPGSPCRRTSSPTRGSPTPSPPAPSRAASSAPA